MRLVNQLPANHWSPAVGSEGDPTALGEGMLIRCHSVPVTGSNSPVSMSKRERLRLPALPCRKKALAGLTAVPSV